MSATQTMETQTTAEEPLAYPNEPPPAYQSGQSKTSPRTYPPSTDITSNLGTSAAAEDISTQELEAAPFTPSAKDFKPCVIPQVSKSFKGPFFSPFTRAYPPALASHGISQAEFLAFIDGVNEAFVANPALQATGALGMVMQQFYGLQPVQFAGIGVQVAAGIGSAALSYGRTRAYFKAVNENLFHPAGLRATVLTTKKMLKEVDFPEEKLSLPPRGRGPLGDETIRQQLEGEDEPSNRRLKALGDHVAPLNFDVPAGSAPESMLRKMGDAQAKKMAAKQKAKLLKKRRKADKKAEKHASGGDKESRKGERKVRRLEKKIDKQHAKMEKKLASGKAARDESERDKVIREADEEIARLENEIAFRTKDLDRESGEWGREETKEANKADRKEEKMVQKIRWIVVLPWSEDGDESEDDSENVSSESDDSDVEHEKPA